MSLLLPFAGGGPQTIAPVTQPPYLGDAYIYDVAGGTGSIAGGTVFDGPNQGAPTGSVSGGTVLPGPNQDSPTGSTTGGIILNPDQVYD